MTKKQLLTALEALVKSGWRLSPKDYVLIRAELEALVAA